MFTGIVQEMGVVQKLESAGGVYKLSIRSGNVYKDAGIGASVAVNGVCLTVSSKRSDTLNFDVMAETVRRTNLIGLKDLDRVNLEGALKVNGSLDGHFVLGHIDCVGRIKSVKKLNDEFMIRVGFDNGFSRLVVEKGSIAIDGISLTVARAAWGELDVYVIPHTAKSTTLYTKRESDSVNLEFDIIGKYALRFRPEADTSRVSEEFLRNNGF